MPCSSYLVALLMVLGAAWPLPAQNLVPTTGARATIGPGAPADVRGLGRRESAHGTIVGRAVDPTGEGLPRAPVRLRDARFGRIFQTRPTDEAGRFEFTNLDPGSYVVELLDGDRGVAAASRLLHLVSGDTVTELIRLPAGKFLAGILGSTAPQAGVVLGAAAAAGVLATGVTGDSVSPR